MSNPVDRRFIMAMLAAAHIKEEDLDRDAAYELIGEFADLELSGENVIETMPNVAFFIATDREFFQTYQRMRADLIELEAEGVPESVFDMAAIEQRIANTIALDPSEFARPLPLPENTPADLATARRQQVQLLLPQWKQTLPARVGQFLSAASSNEVSETVTIRETDRQITLRFLKDGETHRIDGRLSPFDRKQDQITVRFYRVETAPDLNVVAEFETECDKFGRFRFDNLPSARYAVALTTDSEIVGVIWVNL